MLNTQGFGHVKYLELENKYLKEGKEYNIICLTETQKKEEIVKVSEGLYKYVTMRDKEEKRGGGLMILGRDDTQVDWEKGKEKNHKDILILKGTCFGIKMKIILVYFDATKKKDGVDFDRNRELEKEVEREMKGEEGEGVMVLGDFNAHLNVLEEEREDDENGKMVMRWVEEGMILMNADEICEGKYTWGNTRGARSAIDLVMANEEMYRVIEGMEIDEEGKEIGFSDHNMVTVSLKLRDGKGERYRDKEWEKRVYYRKDEESLDQLLVKVKGRWARGMGYEEVWGELVGVQEEVLKKEKKKRVGEKGGERVIECEWINEGILECIRMRRYYNRMKRNTRGEAREAWEKKYQEKKEECMVVVGKAKGEWEASMVKKAREGNGRLVWKVVKEIQGKGRSRGKEYIYEEGQRKAVGEVWGEFLEEWRKDIYQRRVNNVMGTWEGGAGEGLKERYEREIEAWERVRGKFIVQGEGEIGEVMEMPIMTTEELRVRVRNMKKNKAGGPDGVRAEVLQKIVEDDECTEIMVEAMNRICEEGEVPTSWKTSNTTMIKK